MLVNAVDANLLVRARGMPGTSLDVSDSDVLGEAAEARRT